MLSSTRFVLAALVPAALLACSTPSEQVDSNSDKIVGGYEAREGAWPGTVALFMDDMQGCGGALIADQWVLTAGHCVSPTLADGGISKVVIGRHDLRQATGEERKVDRVIRHEGCGWDLDDDLSLLHLVEPSTAPKSKLIAREQLAKLVDGAGVTVVGWGTTSQGGDTSDVLLQVTVPVVPNSVCKAFPQYSNVTDNMICAGYTTGEYDSCQGDSGGPLFMRIAGQPVQVGLVSWGIGCARPNAPGVYTRIGNYLGWIFEKTEGAAGQAATPPTDPASDGGTPPPPPATDAGAPPPPPPGVDAGPRP